jgi:MYXO-CTERM domain-containing protein
VADETARIRSDIEQTRQELGQTAEALATELDPRTRWQRLLDRVRQDPRPLAGVGAAVLLLLVLRRRR